LKPAQTLLAAAALLVATSIGAAAHDLVVVSRGDTLQAAVRKAVVQPFVAATETVVQQESWEGGIDTLRTQAKSPDNMWDMVQVDPEELATGCSEGLFEKLDWSAVGGKDHYLPAAVSDCGVGSVVANLVLAWDRDKFPATPTWADFWDVAKYPGKRGLRAGVRGNLEIALLADGVAPTDVYKTLATNEGVDRAFRKLDQLKPYIVWWQTDTDAARILGSGDVLLTSAPSARIAEAAWSQHRNFGIQWSASLYEIISWAVLKGSANLRQAQNLLYFAGTPAIEARMFRLSGDAGLAKGANDGLPADQQAFSASFQPNLGAGLRYDAGFWHDNLAKLRQRYEQWVGH
jgi:putative spermidine/putrescine transport system substrate-binding protein